MSVIQELLDSQDHIPIEFKRQLLLMRELDDRQCCNDLRWSFIEIALESEKENIKKELQKK